MNNRERIIELLAYPRALARGNVNVLDCPHAGHFDTTDVRCARCDCGIECGWLAHADEASDLDSREIPQLLEALGFALSYVDAQVTRWGHPRRGCACEACRWLRSARRTATRSARADG